MEELAEKLNGMEGVSKFKFFRKRKAISKKITATGIGFELECNLAHGDITAAAKKIGFKISENPKYSNQFFHPLNPRMAISFVPSNQDRRIENGGGIHFAIVSTEALKEKTRVDIAILLKVLIKRSKM